MTLLRAWKFQEVVEKSGSKETFQWRTVSIILKHFWAITTGCTECPEHRIGREKKEEESHRSHAATIRLPLCSFLLFSSEIILCISLSAKTWTRCISLRFLLQFRPQQVTYNYEQGKKEKQCSFILVLSFTEGSNWNGDSLFGLRTFEFFFFKLPINKDRQMQPMRGRMEMKGDFWVRSGGGDD